MVKIRPENVKEMKRLHEVLRSRYELYDDKYRRAHSFSDKLKDWNDSLFNNPMTKRYLQILDGEE